MSHVDAGPLASYNSLLDPHLAGYFSNIRMRRHLIKSGLITRRGNIVSENTYRLNMARKEHKKHVRDLLAQAIVHKTLDMERMRQVAIKQKLEEIAKVEMVRRVKGQPSLWSEMMATLQSPRRPKSCCRNNTTQTRQESCGRHGDEDILPYLKPPHKKGSRPSSVPSGGSGRKGHEEARPVSAPSKSHQKRSRSSGEHRPRIVVDDKGMPHSAQSRSYSGSTDSESRSHSANSRSKSASRYPTEELDDRHLYSLNSQTLRDYTMARYDMDSSRGPSPYRLPQLPPEMIPTPPSSRTPRSPRRPRHRGRSTNSQSKSTSASRSNKGQLMLHRQEPAMKHQERVQTLCDVNMHYFGNSLSLDYERFDPRDEVMVEQQHCGGNTLIVFREKILPGSDFTFTSRRHRGYPFSLTFYVNGVIDCRLSTCCEYKHQSGARLGGKQGHFGMIGVEGAAPCYKCQLNEANSQKKKKRRSRRKAKDTDEDQNVRVPVEEDDKVKDVKVRGIGEDQDRHVSKDDSVEVPVEDDQESTKDEYEEAVPLSSNDLPPPITEEAEEADQESDIYEEDFEEEDSSSKDGKGEGRHSGSGSEDTRYSSEASQVEDGSHIDSHTSEDRKEVGQSSRSNHSAESHSSSTSTLRSRSSSESSSDSDSSYSSGQSSSASSQSGSKLETSKSDEEKRRSDEQSSRSDDGRQRSDGEQLSSDEKRSRSDADSSTLDEDRSRSGEDNSRADEKVQSDEELFSPRGEGSDYDIDLRYQRPIEVKVLCDEGDQPASKESEQQESGQRESDDSSPGSSSSDQEHAAPSLSSRRKKKLRRRHHLETKDKDYNYSEDDFDEGDKKSNASSRSSSYSSRSSRSTSSSTSSSSSNSQDNDDVLWNILVYTSKNQFASTDANVYIILYGDTPSKKDVRSDKIMLNDDENNFEKGKKDEFKRDAPNFEKLTKIRIGHDNSGMASAWHLDRVVLQNTYTGKTFTFHCNSWVSGCQDDTAVERELYPAGSDESKQASKIPKVRWHVKVYTSDVRNAGTDSDVYILLSGETKDGEVKESDKIILDNSQNNFERGQCDEFQIETYDFVKLTKLRIGHNNNGLGAAWHLDKIILENTVSGKSYTFYCKKWLADNMDDQAIERELFPAGSEEARKSDMARKATWHVKVYTSDVRNAGTDSDVYILLSGETKDGEVKESDKIILDNSQNNFERGQCDEFQIETYDFVKLTKLRIGHNNNGLGAAWHLDKVEVRNVSTGDLFTFPCNKWLADDKDDCAVERVLLPDSQTQFNGKQRKFGKDSAEEQQQQSDGEKHDISDDGSSSSSRSSSSGSASSASSAASSRSSLAGDQHAIVAQTANVDGASTELDKERNQNSPSASDKESVKDEQSIKDHEDDRQRSSDTDSCSSVSDKSSDEVDSDSRKDEQGSDQEEKQSIGADKEADKENQQSIREDKESDKEDKASFTDDKGSTRDDEISDKELIRDEKGSDKEDNKSDRDDKESDKESARDEKGSDEDDKESARDEKGSDEDDKVSARDEKGSDKEDKESTIYEKGSDKEDKESARDEKGSDKEDKDSVRDDNRSDKEDKQSVSDDNGSDKEDKESVRDDNGSDKADKASVKDDKESDEKDKESVRDDKELHKEDKVSVAEETNSDTKERESVGDDKEDKDPDNVDKESTRDYNGSDKEDKESIKDDNGSEKEDRESVRDDMGYDRGDKVSAREDTSSDKKERESVRDVKESDKEDKDSTRDDKDSDKEDKVSGGISEVKQESDQQQVDENKDTNEKEEDGFQRTEEERKSPSSSSSYTSGSSSSDSSEEEDNSKQMSSSRQQPDNAVKENDKDDTERPSENLNHVLSPCEEVEGSIRPLIEGRNNIELVNKKLSEDQFRELCDVIKETGEIQALTLRNLNISYRDLEKLTDALTSTKSDDLEMLNLNLNNITPAGASYLAEIVKKKPNLQILLLQNTALGDEGINVLVNALLEVNNKQIEAIYDAAKGMVSSIIASAMETEPASESVNSDATSGGGSSENERLVSALEGDQKHGDLKLEQLDVADCQIEDRGIKLLARLVSTNTKLDHLCLTGNKKVSPAAWRELGEALRKNTNLHECSLDYTELGDEGVDAFLDGAAGNRGLQSLDLEGNRIGDAGGRRILDFVHNQPNLKEVNLTPGNHIDKTIMDQIQEMLDQRN